MAFDYSKLRGRIREIYKTQDSFAAALGIGRVSLSKRLNNSLEFSSREILLSCKLLNFSEREIPLYFFAEEVQEHEHEQ